MVSSSRRRFGPKPADPLPPPLALLGPAPEAIVQQAIAGRLTALADLAPVYRRQHQQLRQKEEMALRMGREIAPEVPSLMAACGHQALAVAQLLDELRPVGSDAEAPLLELEALWTLLGRGQDLAAPLIRYAVVWHFRQLQRTTATSVRDVTRASQRLWVPPEVTATWARQQRQQQALLDPDPAVSPLASPPRPAQPNVFPRRQSVLGHTYDETWASVVRQERGIEPTPAP